MFTEAFKLEPITREEYEDLANQWTKYFIERKVLGPEKKKKHQEGTNYVKIVGTISLPYTEEEVNAFIIQDVVNLQGFIKTAHLYFKDRHNLSSKPRKPINFRKPEDLESYNRKNVLEIALNLKGAEGMTFLEFVLHNSSLVCYDISLSSQHLDNLKIQNPYHDEFKYLTGLAPCSLDTITLTNPADIRRKDISEKMEYMRQHFDPRKFVFE